MKIEAFVVYLGISVSLLSACSTDPIATDSVPMLGSGQGIAAVAFHSYVDATEVVIKPMSGSGKQLYIPSVPIGESIFLFVTPSGRYCMHQFHVGPAIFTARADDQCFDVRPGIISYGGTFSPNVNFQGLLINLSGGMSSGENVTDFLNLLRKNYPKIAAWALSAPSSR